MANEQRMYAVGSLPNHKDCKDCRAVNDQFRGLDTNLECDNHMQARVEFEIACDERLLKAAPDLLDALRACMNEMRYLPNSDPREPEESRKLDAAYNLGLAAIAKAEDA